MENKELINNISESAIKEKIYTIRGIQVMLDSDLAEIYGYKTKNFNRQVKNNIEKFPEDMMFKLTKEDILYLSRCKNFTLNKQNGRGYNIKYYPYVFTEQGIYMLMTVLKGELATKQSLALVRVFKQMKDYLIDNAVVFRRLDKIEFKQLETDEKFRQIFKQLEEPREKKAALFDSTKQNISLHINNVIKDAELDMRTVKDYLTVQLVPFWNRFGMRVVD